MSATAVRLFLLAGLFPAITLWAQLTVSTLRGTATDQTGAVVVGALAPDSPGRGSQGWWYKTAMPER